MSDPHEALRRALREGGAHGVRVSEPGERVVVDSVGPYLRYPVVTAFAARCEDGSIVELVAFRDESVDVIEAALAVRYERAGCDVLADANLGPLEDLYGIRVDKPAVDDVVYRKVHPRLHRLLGSEWLSVRFFGPVMGLGRGEVPTLVTRGLGSHIVGELLGREPEYLNDGEKTCRPYLEVPPERVERVLVELTSRGYGVVFTESAVEVVYTLCRRGLASPDAVEWVYRTQRSWCERPESWPRRSVAEENLRSIEYGLRLLEDV
ncbi:MAG: hypothetical protein ABGY09_04540 [Euryarchaeota archaeon]